MALRFLRGALQLGRNITLIQFEGPVAERFRMLSSRALDLTEEFIKPGFDFGHKPFGPHYGQDVQLGDDGLPLSVDWTKVPGAVWSAQDQGEGSGLCYLFSSMGAIASLNFIKTGESVVLSAQQALDCNTLSGGTIVGGSPFSVMNYAKSGILPASLYPFTGDKGVCKRIRGPGVTIDAWKYVKPNDEYALKYAVSYQPVVVNIRVGKHPLLLDNTIMPFRRYSGGILKGPSYRKLDHSVLLVGYDETELGELYWLLLNSYSTEWGECGLFMIERSTGQQGGALGVLRSPSVPLKWSRNRIITSRCDSCAKCF